MLRRLKKNNGAYEQYKYVKMCGTITIKKSVQIVCTLMISVL